MAKIFINGLNSKAGGGKSILTNYLSLLKQSHRDHRYYILTPNTVDYQQYKDEGMEIIDIAEYYKANALAPIVYLYFLPKILKSLGIDVVFNLGDSIIDSDIRQVYLFDWPYAIYPESVVWKAMDFRSLIHRKVKLFLIKNYIRKASVVIAQTETARKRLMKLYSPSHVEIVPNAVSLDNLVDGNYIQRNIPSDKFKLLYLTYYYPHKNIEIILPLAKRIKQLSLPYIFVTTIGRDQHPNAARFLDIIHAEKLTDVVINLGPVDMKSVPSLYHQCDAVFMPTLLESFSGVYVEAMHHNKIIITSNLDFAKDVCGDSAFYFNPHNNNDALDVITKAYMDNVLRDEKVLAGQARLKKLPTWDATFKMYQSIINGCL